jgi:hypothetical protein
VKPSDRRRVLWVGETAPTAIQEFLDPFGFALTPVAAHQRWPEMAPAARAIVIEFSGDVPSFVSRVRKAHLSLLDHGLAIVLCYRDGDTDRRSEFQRVEQAIALRYAHPHLWPVFQDWLKLAARVAMHNPGPGANGRLIVSESGGDEFTRLALRRAFWDFDTLAVRAVPDEGLSGARVMIVYPRRTDVPNDCVAPKLMKTGPMDLIRGEEATYYDFVRDTVPFNYRPNFAPDRTLLGRESAALVQDFVEAVPFRGAILSGTGASGLAASLFDGALGEWRRASALVINTRVVDDIKERLVSPSIGPVAAHAKRPVGAWPDLRMLSSVPYRLCKIHGDLHPGNVFVGITSRDCILIDFAKCSTQPAAYDPAYLEVMLSLPDARIPSTLLQSMYSWPIPIPHRLRPGDKNRTLVEAVRAIRLFGLGLDRRTAYGLGLIVQLLRFAAFAERPMKRRILAYKLALQLAKGATTP